MREASALLFALVLAWPVSTSAGGPPAQALHKRIAIEGGRKVLLDLWEQRDFNQLIAGIESGDPSWLKIAAALKPFSDGGASLSVNYAPALALPKAPDQVSALTMHASRARCTA